MIRVGYRLNIYLNICVYSNTFCTILLSELKCLKTIFIGNIIYLIH